MNIAEILKDCPKGTKLYSPTCGECRLEHVLTGVNYPIIVTFEQENDKGEATFTAEGHYFVHSFGECLLWPSKDNHDWNNFAALHAAGRMPEAGDFIVSQYGTIGIVNNLSHRANNGTLLIFSANAALCTNHYLDHSEDIIVSPGFTMEFKRFATEEEKMKFLRKLNEAGYIWNPDTNTLGRLYKENDFAVTERGSIFIVDKHRDFGDLSVNKHEYTIKASLYFADNSVNVCTDGVDWNRAVRKATPEERQRLIDHLHDEGYEWTGTEVVKLPTFKPGDIVVTACDGIAILDRPCGIDCGDKWWYVVCLDKEYGRLDRGVYGKPVRLAYTYETAELFGKLTKKGIRYNIATNALEEIPKEPTFKPFEKVLVRDNDQDPWLPGIFSHCRNTGAYKYRVCGGMGYSQCIPYEGNEHLVEDTKNA